jgi:uncharacterized protein (DUF934 family)|tara:strand:+ start:3278 stop:3727 length:450 start_codon:yes stop_codon:yes gene_type:complete
MVILNKDKLQKNDYKFVNELLDITDLNKAKIIVPKILWKEQKKILKEKTEKIGLQINSDESIDDIVDDLSHFSLVQLNFLSFRDGRPFTFAKTLRRKFKFKKEIRAVGHLLPDQYIFLIRCGVDTVEIESQDEEVWVKFFEMDEGLYYQ